MRNSLPPHYVVREIIQGNMEGGRGVNGVPSLEKTIPNGSPSASGKGGDTSGMKGCPSEKNSCTCRQPFQIGLSTTRQIRK